MNPIDTQRRSKHVCTHPYVRHTCNLYINHIIFDGYHDMFVLASSCSSKAAMVLCSCLSCVFKDWISAFSTSTCFISKAILARKQPNTIAFEGFQGRIKLVLVQFWSKNV